MVLDSGEQRAFPGGFSRRRLAFALAASLLAHALLLTGDMARPPQPTAMPGLTANLQPRVAYPSASPPALETSPSPPARLARLTHPSRRRAVTPRDKASNRPVAASRAVLSAPTFSPAPPVPFAAPTTSLSASESAAVAPPRATADAANVPSAAATAALNPSPAQGAAGLPNDVNVNGATAIAVSADGLRRYRLGLAIQARRFKRYPPRALAAGWSGTTNIRLAVDAAGRSEASVARSSGYAVLDEAARTLIAQSAQRTSLPEELRGKAFSIDLPVLFNIADELAGAARAE